jgi:hypothetical protein
MFDSLDEQIKHDEAAGRTARERLLLWVTICVASVTLFGSLFLIVRWIGLSG